MSPPISTPHPDFVFPKPDFPPVQNFRFSDFSAGLTDSGFNYSKSGNEKSDVSSRSRPRLTKIRRKQMVAFKDVKSVKTDFGLNGFSDVNGEIKLDCKSGNVSGGNDGNSMSNGDVKIGDLSGNKEQFRNGSIFGANLNDSLFDSDVNGSTTNNLLRNKVDFLFASDNGGSNLDEEKESELAADANQNLPAGDSLSDPNKNRFPVDTNLESGRFVFGVSDIRSKESRLFKTRSKGHVFKKSENIEFVFGPDKVDLETSGDSEKVSNPRFQFPFNWNNNDSSKNHLNFVFGSNSNDSKVEIDMDNRTTDNNKYMSNSTDCGKENVDIGIQFPNACPNGVFVFGGLKGKGFTNSDGNTKFVNEMNHNIPDNSSSAFGLSDEMRKLNITYSVVDTKKTENLNSNHSVNNDNMFVFGRDKDGFGGVPSVNKDEKDNIRFTSKSSGLDSSDADCSTPNTTFVFSNYNLFPGIDNKVDNANSKSSVGKRLKKKSGKVKQRTVVQQLFGQDSVSEQNGSPMDVSPYQDKNACNDVKVESAVNQKNSSEHCEEEPDDDENSSNFSHSLPVQDGLSALRRQYKKKYKLKVGSNKGNTKQDTVPATAHEVCEHWRIRGNQAYHDGELSKAEEFYSTGIGFAANVSTPGYSIKPLLLCYSNRAAARMSLGRLREAIEDCTKAAEIDPNFLKVTLRAGNCFLVLGEVEDAIQCYSKCLSSGTDVCLDRRITIEAADGLQKAKRVAEFMHQSAKLLQELTDSSASNALSNIDEALSISRFSERLLQMKANALCNLRMYDEAIRFCEQTLDISKKNFDDSNVTSWRWHIQAKSQFHLGRLELALDLIEKQEKMHVDSRSGDGTQDSSIALAATINELLSLKKTGNEAFNSGRYTEAIENYTSAISKSSESRPFMSICFCNRAAAYQSTNQIIDAIADCSLAIALDENYQKAISRRATLHEMIRDYKQAVCDLQRLISLLENRSQTKTQRSGSQSKSNGGSTRDLRKARRRLSSLEEKAKKEIPMDLYLILGIKASDADTEIKKAYRKAALRHHPDKVLVRSDVGDYSTLLKDFGEKIHNDADRLFKIIGEAYAVLSDSSKRLKYDNEEEIRNIYRDSNRNSNAGSTSTSYGSSSERNYRRYYWHEQRTYYSNSHSQW